MIKLERQRQRFGHILSIWVATHFWSNLLGVLGNLSNFNWSDIASNVAVLTLTLSVNGSLLCVGGG